MIDFLKNEKNKNEKQFFENDWFFEDRKKSN